MHAMPDDPVRHYHALTGGSLKPHVDVGVGSYGARMEETMRAVHPEFPVCVQSQFVRARAQSSTRRRPRPRTTPRSSRPSTRPCETRWAGRQTDHSFFKNITTLNNDHCVLSDSIDGGHTTDTRNKRATAPFPTSDGSGSMGTGSYICDVALLRRALRKSYVPLRHCVRSIRRRECIHDWVPTARWTKEKRHPAQGLRDGGKCGSTDGLRCEAGSLLCIIRHGHVDGHHESLNEKDGQTYTSTGIAPVSQPATACVPIPCECTRPPQCHGIS